MDAIKLLSRNTFYLQLDPFKKAYNNYRDDHDFFRVLTHSDGVLVDKGQTVEAHIIPKPNLAPSMINLIKDQLETMNQKNILMPDGTGRKVTFILSNNNNINVSFKQ
jgi:hypothetical protein